MKNVAALPGRTLAWENQPSVNSRHLHAHPGHGRLVRPLALQGPGPGRPAARPLPPTALPHGTGSPGAWHAKPPAGAHYNADAACAAPGLHGGRPAPDGWRREWRRRFQDGNRRLAAVEIAARPRESAGRTKLRRRLGFSASAEARLGRAHGSDGTAGPCPDLHPRRARRPPEVTSESCVVTCESRVVSCESRV